MQNKIIREEWAIKKSEHESLKLTTTEHNRRLINLHLNSTSINFSYEDFVTFFQQLTRIKRSIEIKYYSDSESTPFGNLVVPPIISPGEVSLKEQTELVIPEIFVVTRAGALLFHYDIVGKQQDRLIDKNLLSGLMCAIQLFVENLGWKTGINLLRSGDFEIRFYSGKVMVAMVSTTDLKINSIIDPILIDFATDIGKAFEKKYKEELEIDADQGILEVGAFDEFKEEFHKLLDVYHTQMTELYQKLILSEAISLDVPGEICAQMIHHITEGADMVSEVKNLVEQYPLLKKAILRVNYTSLPIWKIFSVTILKV